MSEIPFYLLAFIVVLGVLIVVHEFGHYMVARWCGVRVLRFSVGFGHPLWQRRLGKDGTEWAIGSFPLGGYVKMLDEREGEVAPEERERAFNRQSVAKRSLIVAAGPAANFLLAIVLYWAVFMHGSEELLPILGTPPAASPAAIAGVVNGEQVRAIDGHAVATWNDLRWTLLQKATSQESADLEVINEQREIAIRRLPLQAAGDEGWEGDALERLGIRFFRPNLPPVVGKVMPGSPGEAAGIRSGDTILAVDGVEVGNWHDSAWRGTGRLLRSTSSRRPFPSVANGSAGLASRWPGVRMPAARSGHSCVTDSWRRAARRLRKPGTSRCSAW